MAKITWAIERPEYGHYMTLVAPTRALAVATAEIEWLKDAAWMRALDGELDPDTGLAVSVPAAAYTIPTFTAKKLRPSGHMPA